MIKLRTVNNDNVIMQEIVLLYLFVFGVSFARERGEHFSFNFGIGPIELQFTLRLWNGTQK